MPRPLVATIHLAALQHNLQVATRHAAGAKVWAVVKANAYGHGLLHAMRAFSAADGLSLIEFDKAVLLREAGWQKPILMLEGCFDEPDWLLAAQYGLQTVIHCPEQIAMLEQALRAGRIDGPIDAHLKLNSGMNRLGFQPAAFAAAYDRLRALPAIGTLTLMTHFANADRPANPGLPLARQVDCFMRSTAGLAGQRSVANSATDLLHPELAGDWVRPGIMLYGGDAGRDPAASFTLQPGMTLASSLIGIQEIQAGDAVGYGSRFIARSAMRIGVVACGYADGYPRHAPDGTPVLVEGVRCALAGRVSMDMLMVDLTPVPAARIGSAVVLWGRGLPIDDVAASAGTIGYELMCAVAPRVRVLVEPDGVEHDPTDKQRLF